MPHLTPLGPVGKREDRRPSSWRKRMAKRVRDRDGAQCAECNKPDGMTCRSGGVGTTNFPLGNRYCVVLWRSVLELDHRIPLHIGGSNDIENLWLLCGQCHQRKTSSEQSARLKSLGAGRNP